MRETRTEKRHGGHSISPNNSKASSPQSRPRQPDSPKIHTLTTRRLETGIREHCIREHRGIYRLALFPAPDRPDLVPWSLWSRNRKEETEGVYSHQTALSLHELSDLNPAKLHITVPRHFRRNSDISGIVMLHFRDLSKSDFQAGPAYNYTRPLRTILDLIEDESIEPTFICQALSQALERGLITRQQLRGARLKEKIHAYTLPRSSPNSRVKDLVDLALLT